MKKIVSYVIVLTTLISTKANSQHGWNVSVKATPHFSWMTNQDDNKLDSFNHRATFNTNFGVSIGYNFTKRSGLELGLFYSLQGRKYELEGMKLNQKMNYVKIPLTYNYVFNPNSKVNLVGKLGPQMSILTGSKLKDNDGKTLVNNTKKYFNNVTFGGIAGLATQFSLGNQWYLTTGLRYDFDFTNAEDKNHPEFTPGRKKTHNTTAGIEVGLKYSFN